MSRARIGLSARFTRSSPADFGIGGKPIQYFEQSVADALARSGALVLMVPSISVESEISPRLLPSHEYAKTLDGLVLQGGVDVAPQSYGEPLSPFSGPVDLARDRYELDLIDAFVRAGKPVLGICRGMQLLNVYGGGTLHQDIASELNSNVIHYCATQREAIEHDIEITSTGRLAALYGSGFRRVNSVHHQCVNRLGSEFIIEAISPADGVVEAISAPSKNYLVGVQWHPEFHHQTSDLALDANMLFSDFLNSC